MSTSSPAEMLSAFQRAVDRNRSLIESSGLKVRVTESLDCPVLYLDKPHWHNRGAVEVPGQIFFSVWQDATGRVNYNIHALKLRHFTAYKLESRKFAEAFRAQFDQKGWPNVSIAYGPLTLMQGFIDASDASLDLVIQRFIAIHHLIDNLLV